MVATMRMSEAGRASLKRYEQLVLRAYLCPAGKWTIGWGHTGNDVKEGLVITEAQARSLFAADLARFEKPLNDSLVHFDTFPQLCFDALVSLMFNIGSKAWATSTIKRMLLDHAVKPCKPRELAAQFARWNKVKGKENVGLVARRADEIYTFACGAYESAWQP